MKLAVVLAQSANFTPTYRPGAIQLTLADLLAQSALRNDTFVIGSPMETIADGTHQPFPLGTYVPTGKGARHQTNRQWRRAVVERLKAVQPDVVLVEQNPNTAGFLKRQFPALPVVLHRHDAQPISFFAKRWVQDWNMRRADLILTNSRFVARHHISRRHQKADTIRVLYNAMMFDRARPPAARHAGKTRTIVCVAAMVPKKGAHLFAAAIDTVLQRHPDWIAVFVSETSGKANEAYRDAIHAIIQSNAPRLTWHDYLRHDEVLAHYEQAAIAVVPSQVDEAFGKTALEAVHAGCALVSSGRGGLREITGEHALYVEDADAQAYADAMLRLIADQELREELATRAWDRAAGLFDTAIVALQFDELLQSLVQGRDATNSG